MEDSHASMGTYSETYEIKDGTLWRIIEFIIDYTKGQFYDRHTGDCEVYINEFTGYYYYYATGRSRTNSRERSRTSFCTATRRFYAIR